MTCELNGKIINPCLTGTAIPSITLGVTEFLENLKDVELENLQNEEVLMYDSDLEKWKNFDYLSLKTTDNLSEGTTNLYDKEVILNAGTGIGISGSYPEFTITNNQVSAVWGNITGTLSDQVDLKNALDLKYNSSSFNTDWDSRLATKTTDNLIEGTTNKYDKTVGLTAGDGIQITGTYPEFTITNVSEGNTDHSALDNLDYANSGHTGFQPTLTAGSGIDITENVISNTGVLTESDPVFNSWDKSTGISITESQISDFGNYLTSESDPVFTSSQAYNITQTDITNLSNLSGTNSGDQESSDFSLAGLSDVDDTAKATGKILQVNSDGDHEYVDFPDPDLSGLVPYSGATGDVDLGNYDLTATDITAEGNLVLSNDNYLQSIDVAGTGKVDILKVNADDEIIAGDDFNFGLMEYATITEPISPDQESTYMYQEATGTRPNRTISLLIKNELGEKIILSTLIV